MRPTALSTLALLGASSLLLLGPANAFVPLPSAGRSSTTTGGTFGAVTVPRRMTDGGGGGDVPTGGESVPTQSATAAQKTMGDVFEEDSSSSGPPKPEVKCPDCDLCDGSGRILGGIGVVLDWWPIKAYRPCPNFIERGGRYVRSGQGLDEIAFGRDSSFNPDDR